VRRVDNYGRTFTVVDPAGGTGHKVLLAWLQLRGSYEQAGMNNRDGEHQAKGRGGWLGVGCFR